MSFTIIARDCSLCVLLPSIIIVVCLAMFCVAVERRRRDRINELIKMLAMIVPGCQKKDATTGTIVGVSLLSGLDNCAYQGCVLATGYCRMLSFLPFVVNTCNLFHIMVFCPTLGKADSEVLQNILQSPVVDSLPKLANS